MNREELYKKYIQQVMDAANAEDPKEMNKINQEYDKKFYDYDENISGEKLKEYLEKTTDMVTPEETNEFKKNLQKHNEKFGTSYDEYTAKKEALKTLRNMANKKPLKQQ